MYSTTEFRIMYRAYDDMLVRKHLIDFDDMIVQCRELLMQREDYRRAWQNKYKYILIDEFQDINKAQFDVVRILADEYRNLLWWGMMTRVYMDSGVLLHR